ncbi:MAG: hypothetical protein R3D52_08880 [Xanthobacteraceae bacterium]
MGDPETPEPEIGAPPPSAGSVSNSLDSPYLVCGGSGDNPYSVTGSGDNAYLVYGGAGDNPFNVSGSEADAYSCGVRQANASFSVGYSLSPASDESTQSTIDTMYIEGYGLVDEKEGQWILYQQERGQVPLGPGYNHSISGPKVEQQISPGQVDRSLRDKPTSGEEPISQRLQETAGEQGLWERFKKWVNGPPIQPGVGDRMGPPGLVVVGGAGAALLGTGSVVCTTLEAAVPYARVAAVVTAPFVVKSSDDIEGLSKVAEIGSFGIANSRPAIKLLLPEEISLVTRRNILSESGGAAAFKEMLPEELSLVTGGGNQFTRSPVIAGAHFPQNQLLRPDIPSELGGVAYSNQAAFKKMLSEQSSLVTGGTPLWGDLVQSLESAGFRVTVGTAKQWTPTQIEAAVVYRDVYNATLSPQKAGSAAHAVLGAAPRGADKMYFGLVAEIKTAIDTPAESVIVQAMHQAESYRPGQPAVVQVFDMLNGIKYFVQRK